ncbi:MAG: Spo0B domain-containing protein [Clostridia bacterium]|nr:Spo0B domain-containing protein [Clostridia bacterium]
MPQESVPEGARWESRAILAVDSADRHRTLNDLQVIAGWLQMGNGEKALAYIRQLHDAAERDRLWRRGMPEDLVGGILVARAQAELRGASVRVEPAPRGWIPPEAPASLGQELVRAVEELERRPGVGEVAIVPFREGGVSGLELTAWERPHGEPASHRVWRWIGPQAREAAAAELPPASAHSE